LQLAIGGFGWFYRYEVYSLIFLTLILTRVVLAHSDSVRHSWLPLAIFLPLLCYLAKGHIAATIQTPLASREVYRQQFQMHRFVAGYYGKSIALNDIGLTSYQRPAGIYILDLVGLASPEVATSTGKSSIWMEQIIHRHHIQLAILYPERFHIPLSWTPTGKMCEPDAVWVLGGKCIVFYSTTPEATSEIREDLVRFVPTLPSGISFEFDPPRE